MIKNILFFMVVSINISAVLQFDTLFKNANELFTKKEFEQALKLYKQARDLDDSQASIHYNIGVTYFELKDYVAAADSFKKALILNPEHGKAAVYLGKIAATQKDFDAAIHYYTYALSYDPGLLDAVNPLVHILKEQLRCEEALIYLKAAYEKHPNNSIVAFNLANTLNMADYTQEALDIYLMLSDKHPHDSSIAYNIAYTYKKLGLLDKALPFYEKTLLLKPEHTEALFSRGLAYLMLGDWDKGWEGYEYRWERGDTQKIRPYKEPLWRGESLHGKHIFVYAEQGLGDTFQFIRYLKILKEMGAFITCAPQKPLMDILRLCPYIDAIIPHHERPESFDYFVPLVSIPYILKTRVDTTPHDIPYLYADPQLEAYWYQELQKNSDFKVGICWQGNSEYNTAFLRAVVANKSIPVHLLEPITHIPHVTVYSLQRVTGTEQQIPDSMRLVTFNTDFDNAHGRFMDTAAVIKNLDLVVTVDTSICHLAAALGISVINILPTPADWRWMLNCSDTPWYPNMQLIRQKTPGDWHTVIDEVVTIITEMTTKKSTESIKKQADIYAQEEQFEEAIRLYTLCYDNDNNDVQSAFNIAVCLLKSGNIAKAIKLFKQLISCVQNPATIQYNLGYTYKMAGNHEKAIALYKSVIQANPEHDQAHLALGFSYLQSGNFKEGWQQHTRFLKQKGRNGEKLRTLLANNAVSGKRILLIYEGGLGDTLMFIRYAKRLKDLGGTIICMVQEPLIPLLSLCPYIDQVIPLTNTLPSHDASSSLMSLPAIFNDTEETLPRSISYLYPDPEINKLWQKIIKQYDNTLKIGICWQSDVYNDVSRLPMARRGIPLILFEQLLTDSRFTFFNLQKKDGCEQVDQLPTHCKIVSYENFDTEHGSFMDSAALIKNLDLVISIDSAIAHLAGALGVPALLLLPYSADWRWITGRSDSPWYPHHILFKQPEPFDWNTVIIQVTNYIEFLYTLKKDCHAKITHNAYASM